MKATGNPATDRTHAATAIIEDSPGGGAFLSVKICPDQQHSAAFWDESVLECALVRDVALASGGLPAEQQGPFFVARFTSVLSAALASRRLQWAVQGFSDSGMTRPSLTVLIQSGEDIARSGFDNQALDEAEGGCILIADAAVKSLEDVPAFVLKSIKGDGYAGRRELTWRAAESRTTRQADEDVLARFIEQTGRASSTAADAVPTGAIAGAPVQARYEVEEYAEADAPPRSRKMLWIGLGSAAAAIGVAAILFLQPGNREKTAAPAATQEPSQSPASPAQALTQAVNATVPAMTTEQKPQQGLTRAQRREEQRKAKEQAQTAANAKSSAPDAQPSPQQESKHGDPPARVTGGCQYAADQIPGLISLAENSRARRQYKDAQRKLQAVLSCEPGNGRAREELELVRQALAAEGGSSDQ